jgi:hypothetical protein
MKISPNEVWTNIPKADNNIGITVSTGGNKKEMVNHPSHYQSSRFEVIDIIEEFNLDFRIGNAIKYILRAGKKGNTKEDLRKAMWYISRYIEKELEEGGE